MVACLIAVLPAAQSVCRAADPQTTDATRATQRRVLQGDTFSDRQDFEDARRGLIEALPGAVIQDAAGKVVWDLRPFLAFEGQDEPAPDTVNPALWRHAQLNNINGLFEVIPGIYQARAFDVAVVTFIRGKQGWIVVDPLTSEESSHAALELLFKHEGKLPVTAVIYTHGHADHYLGAGGVIDPADAAKRGVPILAPEGFLEGLFTESVLAGNAMGRRFQFQSGQGIPIGPAGTVDFGQGKAPGSRGKGGMVPATLFIGAQNSSQVLDGTEFVFQRTDGTESPGEMNFWLPGYHALCMSEVVNHGLHKHRDAAGCAGARRPRLGQIHRRRTGTLGRPGPSPVRHAPLAGMGKGTRDRVVGRPPRPLQIPARSDCTHGEPGLRSHRDRRTDPAPGGNFEKLVESWVLRQLEAGIPRRLPALSGILRRQSGEPGPATASGSGPPVMWTPWAGPPRSCPRPMPPTIRETIDGWWNCCTNWFSPNVDARELQAQAFEQLAYQAESALWRNIYLRGAKELRGCAPDRRAGIGGRWVTAKALHLYDTADVLDYLAVRVNGPRAAAADLSIGVDLSDTGEKLELHLARGVLNYEFRPPRQTPALAVRTTRLVFDGLASSELSLEDARAHGQLGTDGDVAVWTAFTAMLDDFSADFPVLTRPGPVQ